MPANTVIAYRRAGKNPCIAVCTFAEKSYMTVKIDMSLAVCISIISSSFVGVFYCRIFAPWFQEYQCLRSSTIHRPTDIAMIADNLLLLIVMI